MKNLKCLVVDDESAARKGIENYVQKIPFLDLVSSCKSALQATEFIQNEGIDLLFLDINMPHIKGTDFLRTIKNAPHVIFTTAYSEYALESFDFDVIDYLVKPIAFERFLQAANKAYQMLNLSESDSQEYIFVSDSKQLTKVAYDDILYIEANQNYVNIITKNQRLMALVPLKKVLASLPDERFVQVHRGSIVNVTNVDRLEGNQLILGVHKVVISRRMKDDVFKKVFDRKILK